MTTPAELMLAVAKASIEHRKELARFKLDDRELATVLAALRYWQREGWTDPKAPEWEIACDGDLEPMEPEEIDELCERLNCGA